MFASPITIHAQLTAVSVEEPIRVDGRLNEPAWDSAALIDDFTQRELTEGAQPTEPTEVRVLFDDENLYIGVRCFDINPDGIIRTELKRDGDIDSDDSFAFVIDPYNDSRMGFYFAVNPNCARLDASFQSGSSLNTEWDIIWDVAALVGIDGWTCEIVLPFKSLRFPEAPAQTWGINFMRRIRRKNEEILWRGWRRNDGILQLSKAGTLTIERSLRQSSQLDVIPYVLGGLEDERDGGKNDIYRYGADVKYGITTNTTLDITFKTDFAQVESDREVINLTRFDITYPEKRDFFLESAGVFGFGNQLFYSRCIGISPDRREIPILGGAKFTQKTGNFRLGLLNIQTEEEHGVPATNYTVARVRKDVLAQSYVGAMVTNLIDTDSHDNQAYGVDFGYLTDRFLGGQNLTVRGYLAGTVTDGEVDFENTTAGQLYLNFPNDVVSTYLIYHQINPDFNPEVGFVRRTGFKNSLWNLKYTPRVNLPYIKKIVTQPVYINYMTDMNDRLIARDMEFRPFGIETNAGDRMTINYRNAYDYVEQDFTMFKDVVIEQGTYDWWFYMLVFNSSAARIVSGTVAVKWGDYYKGRQEYIQSSLTVKSGSHLSVTADARMNRIEFSAKEFTTEEYGTRFVFDISPNLNSTTFIQYNNAAEEININFRIHWIPKVGSDLYFVYNHLLDEYDEYGRRDLTTLQQAGMLKLDWTYRF